jgi:hypothetical protein
VIRITEPKNYTRISINDIGTFRRHSQGVYFIENEFGEIIYIGKTGNFRRRLREHVLGSAFSALISTIRLYEIPDEYEREIYETFLINKYKPFYNVGKVYENDKNDTAFNEYHELQAQLVALREERQEIKDYFQELQSPDYESEYYGYYDEDDMRQQLLGEQLWKSHRLREIESEIYKLKGQLSTVKSKIL